MHVKSFVQKRWKTESFSGISDPVRKRISGNESNKRYGFWLEQGGCICRFPSVMKRRSSLMSGTGQKRQRSGADPDVNAAAGRSGRKRYWIFSPLALRHLPASDVWIGLPGSMMQWCVEVCYESGSSFTLCQKCESHGAFLRAIYGSFYGPHRFRKATALLKLRKTDLPGNQRASLLQRCLPQYRKKPKKKCRSKITVHRKSACRKEGEEI